MPSIDPNEKIDPAVNFLKFMNENIALSIFIVLLSIISALVLTKLLLLVVIAAHLTPVIVVPFIHFISGSQLFLLGQFASSFFLSYMYFRITTVCLHPDSYTSSSYNDKPHLRSPSSRWTRFLVLNFAIVLAFSFALGASLLTALPVVKVICGVIFELSACMFLLISSTVLISSFFSLIFDLHLASISNMGGMASMYLFGIAVILLCVMMLAFAYFSVSPFLPILASKIPTFLFLHKTSYSIIMTGLSFMLTIICSKFMGSATKNRSHIRRNFKSRLASQFDSPDNNMHGYSCNKRGRADGYLHVTKTPETHLSM